MARNNLMLETKSMAVARNRFSATETKPAMKSVKRQNAILMIEPVQKPTKAGVNPQRSLRIGRLVICGHNFYSNDAILLGTIAFVCGVNSVTASALGSSKSINLRANESGQPQLDAFEFECDRAFLEHFHTGLHMFAYSDEMSCEFASGLVNDKLQLAMAQVPEPLRAKTIITRSGHAESSIFFSNVSVHETRQEKLVQQLESAIQGIFPQLPEFLNIDITQIARFQADSSTAEITKEKIVYNNQTESAMRRLMTAFGFERLPSTWCELNGMLGYCRHLWMASGRQFLATELIPEWQRIGRHIEIRLAPWRVAAFDAYVANDIEKLRSIHMKEKTLERLGAEWKSKLQEAR